MKRLGPYKHPFRCVIPLMLGAALTLVLGCGSVTVAGAIGDAQRSLEEAQGLEAEQNAPYEYTRAAAYLHKARELQGYGLYEQASEYARQSMQAAEKAQDVARLGKDKKQRLEKFAPKAPEDGKARDSKRNVPGLAPSGDE